MEKTNGVNGQMKNSQYTNAMVELGDNNKHKNGKKDAIIESSLNQKPVEN